MSEDFSYEIGTDKPNVLYVVAVLLIGLIILFFGVIPYSINGPREVDRRTKELCREYAQRDHEKEIAPERYKALGKEFFDSFDWYTSCINHTRYPVAGGR